MYGVKYAVLGAVLLALAAPLDLAAQQRGKGKARGKEKKIEHERVEERRDDREVRPDRGRVIFRDRDGRVVIRDRDVDRRYRAAKRGKGPAFCRSGAGHPVHGREWCLEKGFGLGDRGDVFFEDDEVVFWDGDEVVVVRDSRLARDRSVWERVVDAILFWRD